MTRRGPKIVLLVALLAALAALTPLAYATPSDPTWVNGFFDGDDNDNAVFLITSTLVGLDPLPMCGWTPFPMPGLAVPLEDPGRASSHYSSSAEARAPPLS